MKRAIGLLATVLLAVALPACGNSGGKANEAKRAAGLVPGDALGYVNLTIDPSDSQKSDLDGLIAKFPKATQKNFQDLKDQAITRAVKEIGLDYQRDVKPWLGDEIGIAFLPSTPQPNVLGLIKSKDDAQAKAALDKAAKSPNFKATYRMIAGYAVVVDKKQPALLDVVDRQAKDTKSSLSEQQKFTRVVDQLHDDRLAMAWADGHAIVQLAKAAVAQQVGKVKINLSAIPDLGMAGAELHAVSSGAVLQGLVETPGNSGGGTAAITNSLPKDSLGALTMFNLGGAFDSVLGGVVGSSPDVAKGLQQVQQVIGLDIRQDILSWMHGEAVVVAGPPTAGTTPDFALLIEPTDKAKAQAAVAKIASVIEQRAGIRLDQKPAPSGGGTMYVFPGAIRQGIQPAMALLSDRFVLASSPDYLTKVAKGGGGFDGSGAFKDTLDSAKPGTQFQLVLQLSTIRRYVEGLLTGQSKVDYERDVKPWVDHLSAAGLRVRKDGSVTRFELKATTD
jgi:hypothetical protein